jgi:hypothetical protein
MLSYCWNKNASPHLVKELGEKLKRLGVEVWRDEEGSALVHKMEGSTDQKMAFAIENAAAMIVSCSQEYKDSSNCRLECKYAKRLEKGGKLKLIFDMMQEGYFDKADGWLGMYLGDSLWYGLWNDNQMDGAVDSIAKLLGDSVKNVRGGVSARVNIAPAVVAGVPAAAALAPAAGGGATAVHAMHQGCQFAKVGHIWRD